MKFLIVLLTLHVAFTSAMFNSELMVNMPYNAYITFSNPQMSFYGGGALISASHILTCAANVQTFTAWRIGLGSNRRTRHQIFNTNRAMAHPNYSEANNIRTNDVAIIFLNQPAVLSADVFPIFLPPLVSKAQPFLNVQGMVLGFAGSASVGNEGLENLQAAHVRVMSHAECILLYPNADPIQHFCAHDPEQRSNFCLGDQGGAFTILSRDEEFLVGVGSLPGCTTQPSIYTRIGVFREWINRETGM